MLAPKRNGIRNRIRRSTAKLTRSWRNFKNNLNPPRDFFEKRFDEHLQFVDMVEATQDDFFTSHGYEPEPTQEEMIGMDIEDMKKELQKWSPFVLYKSSKRLEKLTKSLTLLTTFLVIFTVVLIILTIHLV